MEGRCGERGNECNWGTYCENHKESIKSFRKLFIVRDFTFLWKLAISVLNILCILVQDTDVLLSCSQWYISPCAALYTPSLFQEQCIRNHHGSVLECDL